MLVVRGKRQNRIYMMRCAGAYGSGRRAVSYGSAKITVIIKYT